MKTDKEWEARARELAQESAQYEGGLLSAMLQLGREMVEEARAECGGDDWRAAVRVAELRAADARAEEIARDAEQVDSNLTTRSEYWRGYKAALLSLADRARSTIRTEKKATEPMTKGEAALWATPPDVVQAEDAIRADERRLVTKEILDRLLADGSGLGWSLKMTGGQPQTREQVLEEALRSARDDAIALGLDDTRRNIERALEWKP